MPDKTENPAEAALRILQERVRGTNINAQTLLATDYLNHFNEVIMLLDMVPDMPDVFEDVRAWQPCSYPDHFRRSGFSDRDLAVEAYAHAPRRFREPFDRTVAQINTLVIAAVGQAEGRLAVGVESELLRNELAAYQALVRRLIETASGIIHGSEAIMDQGDIDCLLSGASPPPPASSQADIDALFN